MSGTRILGANSGSRGSPKSRSQEKSQLAIFWVTSRHMLDTCAALNGASFSCFLAQQAAKRAWQKAIRRCAGQLSVTGAAALAGRCG